MHVNWSYYLKSPFCESYCCVVLKLTVYVRNIISFFYKNKNKTKQKKKKNGEKPIFGTFLATFSDFGLCFTLFTENWLLQGSLWRHALDVCTYLGMYGMRRPMIAILWYQLDIIWGFSFQNHREVVITTLVGLNRVTDWRLGKTTVI